MKNILFLTGRYLPRPSPNGICVQNVIEAMSPDEYDVTCICYDDKQSADTKHVDVHKISRGLIQTLIYRTEGRQTGCCKLLRKILLILKKIKDVPFLLTWPWSDPIFTRKAYRKALRLHKVKKFDVIVAVHLPFSALIVGHKMKKKYPEIKYVPYLLDTLSGGMPFNTKLVPKKWMFKKKLKWECKLFANADTVVAMESSRKHHEQYNSENHFYDKITFLGIPLLKKSEVETACDVIGKTNMMFCGTAHYPMRNVPYFMSVLNVIKNDDIAFTLIGDCNCTQLFGNMKKDSVKVKHLPRVSHAEMERFYQRADILVNLGNKEAAVIPSKIFEYMSYGKPIISTYAIDNDACIPYLEKYPLSLLLDERETDLEEQAKRLESFIISTNDKHVDFEEIQSAFKHNRPETFVEEIL
ncbi:MAG: glycosyltransferase [Oscillospiraceae bacterium]|nr:glycosyltransferase [Oscillospiraceae bacterium]